MNDTMRKSVQVFLKFLGKFLIVYLILVAGMTIFQRKFAYAPSGEDPEPGLYGAGHMREVSYNGIDGTKLEGWFTAPQHENAPIILFYHGNAGHLGTRGYKSVPFTDAGYGFLFAGYRGYGGNPGKPTEEGIYRDARAAYDWLKSKYPDNPVILYGESLGTAVAVHAAANFADPSAIVLEAPFTSAVDVGQYRYFFLPVDWLLWDRYESIAKIGSVEAPLFVYHGTDDTIVPIAMGKKLFEAANGPKVFHTVDKGHNNVYSGAVAQEILSFLETYSRHKDLRSKSNE